MYKVTGINPRYEVAQEGVNNMEEKDIRVCPYCNKEVERQNMDFTRDCYGITFRLVCFDCYEKLMAKGYDGQYYTESDECIDDDY